MIMQMLAAMIFADIGPSSTMQIQNQMIPLLIKRESILTTENRMNDFPSALFEFFRKTKVLQNK